MESNEAAHDAAPSERDPENPTKAAGDKNAETGAKSDITKNPKGNNATHKMLRSQRAPKGGTGLVVKREARFRQWRNAAPRSGALAAEVMPRLKNVAP